MRNVKKNDLKKKSVSFERLDEKELQNVRGGGYFYWDSTTKTLWYIPT